MDKAAAKYTATPPKTGTSVVWDFLVDGESVIFFASANLRIVGTKYRERIAAKNWAKNPYNKISFDMYSITPSAILQIKKIIDTNLHFYLINHTLHR